jgi:hypothetical protein
MPDFLRRELTPCAQTLQSALRSAVEERREGLGGAQAIARLAAAHPTELCTAGLRLLSSDGDFGGQAWLCARLAECPGFLVQLVEPKRFSRDEAIGICRGLLKLDEMLDVRLSRLTPGRHPEQCLLSADAVVRALDILDGISPGGRLILLLNHLTRYPNRRIAAKATLLIGRRLRNPAWVARHLESDNPRLRANVVEGLWGAPPKAARTCLWANLKDRNNRVVGNALIGLHQLGESAVGEFAKRMIEDSRAAFRWTAAWVMGKIGSPEFVEVLGEALHDKDSHVRVAAERALTAILQANGEAGQNLASTSNGSMTTREGPASEDILVFDGKCVRQHRRADHVDGRPVILP